MTTISLTGRAQVTLTIEKIDTTLFPLMDVHIVTEIDGILRRDLTASDFSVTEGAVPQGPVSYNCPQSNSAFSLAILMGRGSSLNQSQLDMSKGAADAVVTSMDGVMDESSIISYSTIVSTDVFLTNDKVLLQNGINGLTLIPTGQNRFWDGLATAVSEISSNGTNTTKAVLVLSNGEDDASTNSLNSVLSLAVSLGIKVYCVGIGVGAGSGGAANLLGIATGTGGKYWPGPSGGWEQSLVNLLRGTPEACVLQYTSNDPCRDGFPRALQITATTGNRSGSVNGQYQMSMDPSTFQSALFAIDTATVTGGRSGELPLLLRTPLNGNRFHPAHITLFYDTSKIRLLDGRTDGSLLDGMSVAVTALATGARLDLTGQKVVNGDGILLRLVFQTRDVQQAVNVPVSIALFTFDRGCLIPQTAPGSILVLPKVHAMSHRTEGPAALAWDVPAKEYSPNPFEVLIRVQNSGDLPLTDIRGTIQLDTGLEFLAGYTSEQVALPASLDTTEEALLKWEMRALPQLSPRTLRLNFSITCAESVRTTGSMQIPADQAGARLSMRCEAPQIGIENNEYKPNPFIVTLRVDNTGGTSSVPTAQILLPPRLTLDNDQEFKSMGEIHPSDSGSVQWSVRAAKSGVQENYLVPIIIRGSGIRADTCVVTVRTPPLGMIPVITTTCLESPVITYDGGTKSYDPNPFTSAVVLRNSGLVRSDSLQVRLTLPGELSSPVTIRKIPGIEVNDSARVEWTIHIPTLACSLTTARMILEVLEKGQILETCHTDVSLPPRQNAPPSILSRNPQQIDTVHVGESVSFSIQAVDPDNDSLRVRWTVNGMDAGMDSTAYTRLFSVAGSETITCRVTDGCATDSVRWQLFVDTPLSAGQQPGAPGEFALYQNYPKPIRLRNNGNPGALIGFHIPDGEHHVEIRLLDLTGRTIGIIADALYTGGKHFINLERFLLSPERGNLPSGMYFYRMTSGTFVGMRALLVLP